MRVSYRRAKRVWAKYQRERAAGLRHGNAGRVSSRKRPATERGKILGLVREKSEGFGPTLAAEHPGSEDQLNVHAERLRRWMIEEGLWKRARKR